MESFVGRPQIFWNIFKQSILWISNGTTMQPSTQGYSVGVSFILLPLHIWSRCQYRSFRVHTNTYIRIAMLCNGPQQPFDTKESFLGPLPPLHMSALPGLFAFEFSSPLFNFLLDNSLAKLCVLLLLKTCQSFIFPPWYYFYLYSMSTCWREAGLFTLALLWAPSCAQNHTLYLFVLYHTAVQSRSGKHQGCTSHTLPFSGS